MFDLCTVSLLLYLMALKTISPGSGVWASLMLFFHNTFMKIPRGRRVIRAIVERERRADFYIEDTREDIEEAEMKNDTEEGQRVEQETRKECERVKDTDERMETDRSHRNTAPIF